LVIAPEEAFYGEERAKLLQQNSSSSSPPAKKALLLVDHKLAIAYWCVTTLYQHVFELSKKLAPHISSKAEELKDASRAVLLISPDCYTVLNMRKEMIKAGALHPAEEIRLLNLIFSKHPKSGEAWAHRRWVLEQLDWQEFLKAAHSEIQIAGRTAEVYPKNYYSWTHRLWVLERVKHFSTLHSHINTTQWYLDDLKLMDEWTKKHVSDNCGFHHRRSLLSKICGLTEKKPSSIPAHGALWLKEIQTVNELIELYPGHETLWLHKRFLHTRWYSHFFPPHAQHSDPSFIASFPSEITFADRCIEDDEASHFEEQKRHALSFKLWVLQSALKIGEAPSNEIGPMLLQSLHDLRLATPHLKKLWEHQLESLEHSAAPGSRNK